MKLAQLGRKINDYLKKSQLPLFLHEIHEKVSRESGFEHVTIEDISKEIKKSSGLYESINERYFSLEHAYFKKFIRLYKYLKNTLKHSVGSEGSLIIPFLFFCERELDGAISNIRRRLESNAPENASGYVLETLQKDTLRLANKYPSLTQFLRDMMILLADNFGNQDREQILIEVMTCISDLELRNEDIKRISTLFDYVLIDSLSEKDENFSESDLSASDIIAHLAQLEAHMSIAAPAFGIGSLITRIDMLEFLDISVTGFEKSETLRSLATMNCIIHKVKKFEILPDTSSEGIKGRLFDRVISEPLEIPQGLSSAGHTAREHRSTVGQLHKTIELIDEKGMALLVVSDRFLYSSRTDDVRFRKELVMKGWLSATIKLPPTRNTGLGKNLLVVKKRADASMHRVKFLDLQLPGRSNYIELVRTLNEDKLDKGIVELNRYQLEKYSYNLSPGLYNEGLLEAEELVANGKADTLKGLCEIKIFKAVKKHAGRKEKVPTIIPFDLEASINEIYLDENRVTYRELDTPINYLSQEAIVINRSGRRVKPMIFKPSEALPRMALTPNFLVIIPKPNKIRLEYLYYQFYAAVVQNQLKGFQYQFAAAVPRVTIQEISRLIVPIMTFDAQKEYVEAQGLNIREQHREKKREEEEKKSLKAKQQATETEVISTLVHQLRGKIITINNVMDSISHVVKSNDLGHHREFSEEHMMLMAEEGFTPPNISMADYCNTLVDSGRVLEEELTFVRKVMQYELSRNAITLVKLKTFLNDYVQQCKTTDAKELSFKVSGHDVEVECDKMSIKEIADQFIKNTLRHGMLEDKEITVSLHVEEFKENLRWSLSNNGRNFDLPFEAFTSAYSKGANSNGQGIGGNYIKKIVDAYDGSIWPGKKAPGFSIIIEFPLNRT